MGREKIMPRREARRTMTISHEVVGCLGGASRQAVHKSGDVAGWLGARVRRQMVGLRPRSVRAAAMAARGKMDVMLKEVRDRLTSRGSWGGRGRRRGEDAEALGTLLGCGHYTGETVYAVYRRWLQGEVGRLFGLSRQKGRPRGWRGVAMWLDARWHRRWVGRLCGKWARMPEGRRFVSEAAASQSEEVSDSYEESSEYASGYVEETDDVWSGGETSEPDVCENEDLWSDGEESLLYD